MDLIKIFPLPTSWGRCWGLSSPAVSCKFRIFDVEEYVPIYEGNLKTTGGLTLKFELARGKLVGVQSREVLPG